jgi:glycosyltransferase involved in cell wall biosynthesis
VSTQVAHFSSQLSGGANIAGRRLHDAMRRAGLDSRFYYGSGESNDPNVLPLFENRSFFKRNAAALAISWRNRQSKPGAFVTSPRWIRKTPIQAINTVPKVVSLHWVTRWLDVPTFFESLPAGIPVVWTLHDLIPIAGGCHFPGDCPGVVNECGNCPLLRRPHANDSSHRFFKTRAHWYQRTNLHFIGNSHWTTEQAKRSALGRMAKSIRTIHLGLNVNDFQPVDKITARQALRLPQDKFLVGFACSDFHEKRKGAELLLQALAGLPREKVVLLVLGGGLWPRNLTGVETVQMGSIGSPRLQSIFYSALDVFAMPSQIETFGMVAMEAMACGTPVVAFPAGGLADVVAHGETGWIEPEFGNVAGFSQLLQRMMNHPAERNAMGIAARQRVVEHFSDTLMAARYKKIFHELLPDEPAFFQNGEPVNFPV